MKVVHGRVVTISRGKRIAEYTNRRVHGSVGLSLTTNKAYRAYRAWVSDFGPFLLRGLTTDARRADKELQARAPRLDIRERPADAGRAVGEV